ncbi:SGNH hydrolase [Daedaleopsis nitida]|nr:SGNH hydrolase [Daedaleopsis nitida]
MCFLASLSFLALAFGASAAPSARAPSDRQRSFIIIGDSTSKYDGGWGPGFCISTKDITTVTCINLAVSGGTTGGFFESGLFETSLAAVGAEAALGHRPVVTVQYGHNDQKIAPAEGMGKNLTTIVKAIKAVGGSPILVTSLTRRNFFANGTIDDALELWAEETIKVAHAQRLPLLDLHAQSVEYCEAIGPEASHRLNYLPTDNTHLNPNGATVFGRMVADLMVAALGNSTSLGIIANPELTYNITHGIPSY